MKRRSFISALGASLAATQVGSVGATTGGDRDVHGSATNVIVMMGDGMGFDTIQSTSHVHADLEMESLTTAGLTRTFPREGEVTDSAAAGTALATGFKAHNGQLSVRGPASAGDDAHTPLTTQLELAQEFGMSTGLVTTTRLTHASPAAYAAHVPDRDMEGEIANQYLEREPEVMLGGGAEIWSDEQLSRAEELGYEVLSDSEDLTTAGDNKLLGLFDDSHIAYTVDREDTHPNLTQMVNEAVERLERSEEGFFLFVEGGRIDHACHLADPWTAVSETKEFDDTVGWVRDYVAERDDTLMIATADHETGGMSTGNGEYGAVLDTDALTSATASTVAMYVAIAQGGDIRGVVNRHLDFEGELSSEERLRIRDAIEEGALVGSSTIGTVLSPYVGIDWPDHPGPGHPSPMNAHTGPSQIALAAGAGVDGAGLSGWHHHHTDLSATISAILMFGGVEAVPEAYRGQWEQRVTQRGANGVRDAYIALQYLGPVEEDTPLHSALDVNDDGVIDLADVLAIHGEGAVGEESTEDRSADLRVNTPMSVSGPEAPHDF